MPDVGEVVLPKLTANGQFPGTVAELAVEHALTKRCFVVFRPQVDDEIDLVVKPPNSGQLFRLQVKTTYIDTNHPGGNNFHKSRSVLEYLGGGGRKKTYGLPYKNVDAFMVVDGEDIYVVPIGVVNGHEAKTRVSMAYIAGYRNAWWVFGECQSAPIPRPRRTHPDQGLLFVE